MTRKEELLKRSRDLVMCGNLDSASGVDNLTSAIHRAFQRVEREVWGKCQDKIESLMEKENESTDDQIWELRDWCKQQQEGL